MSDVAESTETLDLDAALARTYRRYDELRRRAVTRRRWATGGLAVAAAVVIAVIVPLTTGSGPSHKTQVPALAGHSESTTTTSDPNAEPLVPAGFVLSEDGLVRTLTSMTQPPSDVSSAPGVGASSATTERARVVSSSRGPVLRSVTVRFNCFRLPEQLSEISYELTPQALVVAASLSYVPDGKACPSPNAGPVITLPLAVPLPAGLPVVAGSVLSH